MSSLLRVARAGQFIYSASEIQGDISYWSITVSVFWALRQYGNVKEAGKEIASLAVDGR